MSKELIQHSKSIQNDLNKFILYLLERERYLEVCKKQVDENTLSCLADRF